MELLITWLTLSIVINLIMFIPAYFFKTDKLTDISYALTFIVLSLLMITYHNIWIISFMIIIRAIRLGTYLLIRIMKIQKDNRFDEMRNDRKKFIKFWLLQWISVAIISTSLLLSTSNDVSILWIVIRAIGLLIESFADYQKFQFILNKKIWWIQTWIWRYSRHPNYFGEILCRIWVYIAVLPNLIGINKIIALISPIFIIILLLFVSGIPLLEKSAQKKWWKDKAYKEYVKKTSILIPRFNKY
jgi:steroid 5-alpha reductase family enzyme